MIQLIAGDKGIGKTKILLNLVEQAVKDAHGSIVYIDKSNQHMFELNRQVRLINSKDYCITNSSEFVGFISGILSQDHDLEKIYVDSFLKIACVEDTGEDIEPILQKLKNISDAFGVTIIMSISRDKEDIPESFRDMVEVAL